MDKTPKIFTAGCPNCQAYYAGIVIHDNDETLADIGRTAIEALCDGKRLGVTSGEVRLGECLCRKDSARIVTDNTQTLYNALARIAELEAQLAAARAGVVVQSLMWGGKDPIAEAIAKTPFGAYIIWLKGSFALWHFRGIGCHEPGSSGFNDSLEAAQAACEAHWQATMREALGLTPVE